MIKEEMTYSANLSNNCPTCYSNEGLEFLFFRKIKDNLLAISKTKEVTGKLQCKTCNTTIYPVNWTEDIERVHEYHKKMATPAKTSLILKPLAYVLIVIDALLLGFLIYYFI